MASPVSVLSKFPSIKDLHSAPPRLFQSQYEKMDMQELNAMDDTIDNLKKEVASEDAACHELQTSGSTRNGPF